MPAPEAGGGPAGSRSSRGLFVRLVVWWCAFWHNLVIRKGVAPSLKAGLDAAEEIVNGCLREGLQLLQRALNGASAFTLSVFNRDYKAQLRGRWTVLQEQYSWWGQADTGRSSTLNAVLARTNNGDDEGGTPAAAAAHAAAAAPQAVSQDGLRHRTPAAAAATSQPSPTQQHQQHQQPGRPADAADMAAGGPQWWGQRRATEAAAAAQEAATAAVQQAASTMSQAVEEAAATAAGWARSMRAVFVEPPAGWGVHEAIKQTGLLEDVSLHGQLFISRMFDRLRWLLGKLTLSTLSNNTPTAAVAAARQRAAGGGSILQQAAAGGAPRTHGSSRLSSSSTAASTASTAAGPVHAAAAAAAPPARGLFGRFRRSAGVHGAGGIAAAAAAGGVDGGSRRLKLRSFTSVDLPRTHRLSLEEDADVAYQRGHTAGVDSDDSDESGVSDASSGGAYDSAVEDAVSSQASCSSSTSSFAAAAQPAAAAPAAAVASSPSAAAADLADLAGPPLTVRVPHSALSSANSNGLSSRGSGGLKTPQGRVSFAADADAGQQQQQPQQQPASGGAPDATPFGTLRAQQQLQDDLAARGGAPKQQQDQPQQAALVGPAADVQPGSTRTSKSSSSSTGRRRHHQQRLHGGVGVPEGLGSVLPGRGRQRLQRSHSGPAVSVLRDVSSAGQVIRMAGYPLEVHEVVTPDGYLLRMERIPQPTATDAVFMMHGVLDTSLTWVAGGITGSQAFAAWDRGFDVWLGTSRSNPPHEAADPARRGSRYWVYSHNEVGVHDMGAQIDHIHNTKMRELTALGRRRSTTSSMRWASGSDAAKAAPNRRPSGRPSGSSSSRQRPVPEHTDILDSVVDADVLVGIRPLSSQGHSSRGAAGGSAVSATAAAAASTAGGASKPCAAEAPGGDGDGPDQQPEAGSSDSAADAFVTDTSTCSSGSGSGSTPGAAGMSRAQSAVEIDQAAAAEAAAAFKSHRAALAAAGIGHEQQQQQQQPQPPEHVRPATPQRLQELLAPLTPTAAAAAAAASRAANALGSAVASAAAAAGGMIGIAAAGAAGSSPELAAAEAAVADAGAEFGRVSGRRYSSCSGVAAAATVSAKPAASGLLERLLGGTVPAASAADAGYAGGAGGLLQPQGSGMRHVSSAPDVSLLAGLLEPGTCAEGDEAGSNSSSSGGGGKVQPTGSAASTSGGGDAADSSARRARRSSCPYSIGPLSNTAAGTDPDAGSSAGVPAESEQPQQLQQPLQSGAVAVSAQEQPVMSPFSQQQQPQPRQQQQPSPVPQQQPQDLRSRPPSRSDAAAASATATGSASAPAPQALQGASSVGAGARVARSSSWGVEPRPYNLRVVCHSLGGMLLLIYCTQRARAGRPHHVSRLILLSPAGFHPVIPSLFKPLVYVWRPFMLYTQLVWRQQGFPVHLPTFVARMLAFKLSVDTSKLPAVGDLLRTMARLLLGGDRSAWDRALLMPHYTAAGMPLLSSRQVLHFVQLYLTGRCQLFDYGSEGANVAEYQQRTPPVVSDAYHMLRDVPVHLVAGKHDGVIAASNIRCHYAAMKAADMDVSYREFDYGHMDFTFSAKEELGWYVMSLLMRT